MIQVILSYTGTIDQPMPHKTFSNTQKGEDPLGQAGVCVCGGSY